MIRHITDVTEGDMIVQFERTGACEVEHGPETYSVVVSESYPTLNLTTIEDSETGTEIATNSSDGMWWVVTGAEGGSGPFSDVNIYVATSGDVESFTRDRVVEATFAVFLHVTADTKDGVVTDARWDFSDSLQDDGPDDETTELKNRIASWVDNALAPAVEQQSHQTVTDHGDTPDLKPRLES